MPITMRTLRTEQDTAKPLRACIYYPSSSKSAQTIQKAQQELNKQIGSNASYSVMVAALASFYLAHKDQFVAEQHLTF